MIKRVLVFVVVALFLVLFLASIMEYEIPDRPEGVAADYLEREPAELGAQNVVTAIVVTYRGLDTLGEVSVLFLAAAGIALLLGRGKGGSGGHGREKGKAGAPARKASEILETGADFLIPLMVMFGAYIFIGGHLSPGGGFQGGAVIASGILLLMLAFPRFRPGHALLSAVESLSGTFYVIIGILGFVLASGFLDSRFIPLGEYGRILSAGAIPLIYTFIGIKVGTELAAIVQNMGGRKA